jgi:penicillin-binding protein 1C
MTKRRIRKHHVRAGILTGLSAALILTGLGALWVATLPMPDLHSFENRKVTESTKIYDRTGEILLYDTGKNAKRTAVSLSEISPLIQKATIAIEDSDFYTNIGIEPMSIIRAVLADLVSGSLQQGASTITQQVVKNSLLTKDKTLTRKIKEWVIAIKLTQVVSKEEILETYLNETPYGGTIYSVEEASRAFFGRPAADVTLAQAAYLAAIPQAPTYYSPYGTHREDLDKRKNLVLQRMKILGYISEEEYNAAMEEEIQFLSKNEGIRAPHFVMMVREYLTEKYGEERSTYGGLSVITTLDYSMQEKAQSTVSKFSPSLEKNFNASNTAMVAIDPKTGDILAMVGSRDYFDATIDGNYNIALAKRQPGSTFKPFVYASLFEDGYTPETILFDVKTEFSTKCTVEGKPKNPADDPKKVCYSPVDFDDEFPGPMSVRKALAQSRNIPAVKALYLTGINKVLRTARDMGITTLTDPDRYGLTLVLGGGEVSLLELTSAYGVFANDGLRNPYRSILEVRDGDEVIEKAATRTSQGMPSEIVRQISDILSDNSVRMDSLKPIADSVGRQVAIKTGTTNDYRDVWTFGYTPNLVVGAWAGKNDNTPMQHNVAGLIISPVWGAFMSQAVKDMPRENFKAPPPPITDNKPVLHGIWQGGTSYWVDKISGKLATEYTPLETRQEVVSNGVHTILQWLDKDDPNGPAPRNPSEDSQYEYWEYGVRKWFDNWKLNNPGFAESTTIVMPSGSDDVHGPGKALTIKVISPDANSTVDRHALFNVRLQASGSQQPRKTEVYLNGKYVLTVEKDPLNFSFVPNDVGGLAEKNTLTMTVYDTAYNKGEVKLEFGVK